jgi:hypothetical protein
MAGRGGAGGRIDAAGARHRLALGFVLLLVIWRMPRIDSEAHILEQSEVDDRAGSDVAPAGAARAVLEA